jgi:hypothetical protein
LIVKALALLNESPQAVTSLPNVKNTKYMLVDEA